MVSRSGLAEYEGREQAFVKHELLTAYLERFMMILGQHFPTVLYVDCFAGPWGSTSSNYGDTSFGRAIQIIQSCQKKLKDDFGRSPKFRALFLEKDASAFAKLKEFAASSCAPGLDVDAWHGEFQNKVEEIASWIGSDFAFVLIDPKGYKEVVAPQTLAPLLRKRNVEALINYMWQFLSLAVGHLDKAAHMENMVALFGDGVRNVPGSGEPSRESWLLNLYRERLVQSSAPTGESRTRTVAFPVEYPGRSTTKYFLIHVTHNDVGVIKFSEASKAAATAQNSVRFSVIQRKKENKTGITDLFPDSDPEPMIGDRELKEPWLDLMPVAGCEIQVGEPEIARLIERYNCFIPELQKGLQALIQSGQVQNLDMKRPRPKNAVHYRNRERLKRIR